MNIRSLAFDHWLENAAPHEPFVYHRGELARDKAQDPDLAALADRMLQASTGHFEVVSLCGHVRGEIIGTKELEVYLARKLMIL
jgi:hypothetical protein